MAPFAFSSMRAVSVSNIHVPIFAVATETDHVAPWRSVYKISLLNGGEIAFVLTTGGHNAGIVSEPGHRRRSYAIGVRAAGEAYQAPDQWRAEAESREGSWWPAWTRWLDVRSGALEAPPGMGASDLPPLEPAPGGYVFTLRICRRLRADPRLARTLTSVKAGPSGEPSFWAQRRSGVECGQAWTDGDS